MQFSIVFMIVFTEKELDGLSQPFLCVMQNVLVG